jgi:hypothetical protein
MHNSVYSIRFNIYWALICKNSWENWGLES